MSKTRRRTSRLDLLETRLTGPKKDRPLRSSQRG